MMSPNPASRTRLLSNRTLRLAALLSLVGIAATILASTNSSARSMGQRLFAGVAAIMTGGSPAASVAPANHSNTSNAEEAAPQGPSSTMTVARRGHTATRLSDGRVLIAGGDNAGGGYLGEAEIFDPASGTFAVTGSMGLGRSDHAAVQLADGKVLISGGRTATGTTNTTEVFDPTTGTFVPGPAMSVARASHSATLFADGRIFIAGGDANGSAEILDSGSFSVAGNLAAARAKHSAALLLDGRVLVVGGRDTSGTDLSSMEVFDPADQSFSNVGDLKMARVLPHLRVLFDGKVQVIGGNNDESMEIYDPVSRELGAYAHVLPATDTCTGLRPGILASQTRAALFHNGQSDALLDRSGHIINELSGSSQALVAGGANSSGIVLDSISVLASSPSSITTDKLDYAPGETVKISGRGWQPGETVRVRIHEDPHTPQERGFDIVADGSGSFVGTYLVQDYDLDMKFIVGARGLTSGWNAQTTFTDANNDAHIAPGWAATNTVTTFNTLYRKTTGGTVQHVRITLPVGYTNISVAAMAFSSGTWSTPVVNQVTRTIDTQLTAGTGLATNNVDWARIDVTATTPPANQSGNAADWLMQTFTNTAGTVGEQNDNPPVLIGNITNPTATITFVDAGGVPIVSPVLQNGVAATVRVRITQTGNGIKYTDVAVPTCFSSPSSVTATVSAGGNAYDTPILVTDGFIRLSGGAIATNGTLTVQFNTTPNCTSGTYLVSSTPSTNASNPPSGTNQSVSTAGGSLTIAAGRADLSITKTDSPDPVAIGGTLTYTIDVNNAGPDDASAVKVVDTLPSGVTFVSATGTNWNCNHSSGTVTCNRTGGNLAPGAAPAITIVVTAPATAGSITNTATVSSPNDNTPGNNTATATTTVAAANSAPAGTDKTVSINEDSVYTFAAADFGFTDPGDTPPDALSAVKITTVATDGKLKLNGVDVTAGQFIPVADINAGNLKFFPDVNENGTPYASFTFQVQDDGGTAAGGIDLDPTPNTMTINVTSVNDEPSGTDNTVTTNEDTAYTFAAADFGFTDPNDTSANFLAAVKITTVATNGKLKLNGVDVTAGQSVSVADITTGQLKFFPDANENGSPYATFTFQVQDNGGTANGGVDLDQSANTMTVNVNSVNDEPAGANNAVTTNEDTAYTFAAAEFGFTDPNDTPTNSLAAVKITSVASDGKLKLNGVDVTAGQFILVADINAGNLKFFPDANESGSPYATFTFQVQDDGGTANGGVDLDQSANTMTINVIAVNDEPAGTNNTVTTNEDTTYTFTAADFGFTDPNDTPANAFAAVKIATIASDGKLKLNGVDVTAGQSIPIADINAGNLKFFPDTNESGSPYATFTFQVQDDGGTANGGVDLDQSPNTMTVNVTAVNDEPAGTDNTVTTNEDTAHTFAAAEFGFTDPNDTPANALAAVKITTVATDGKLKLSGVDVTPGQVIPVAAINAGNLKFFPDANESGSPYATFTFQVQDDGGTTNGGVDLDQSANTMTINVTAVNDEPAGTDNAVTTNEDTPYTFAAAEFGFSDPNDTPANTLAAVKITTVATDGKLKLSGVDVTPGQFISVADITAGNLRFFPDANENGTPYAAFTFQVQDNGGTANGGVDLDQSPNTMTINVTAVNDTPDAVDDSATVDEDSTNNSINVLANDSDPDNLAPPANAGLTVIAVTQGTHGSVTFTAAGVSYTPNANYFGTDSFTYTISDDGTGDPGHTDTATVNVTINNINDAPDAIDDSATVDEDTINNAINVLANDTDADNLTPPANAGLTVIAVTQGTHGSVTFTATGVSYTPAPNYFGTDSFTYTISDNGTADPGHTDTATVNVTINNINDPPDAVDDSATVDEDTTNNAINVLANDTDADNLTPPANAGLTVIAVTQGTHGSVTFTTGGVSYTPAPNYFGTDSFTYTISDDGTADPGHTDTATVNVTINNINDAPDAIDDSATVDEDTTNNAINVLANDTDADNLTPPANAGLTVIAVTQGTHGSVTFTATGVSYTPAPNYFGTDSFTYTISDNGTADPGHTDTATVNVTINNINDPPDAVDDSATVDEDTTNNAINVLANDTDADNLTPPANAGLTVIAVTQGTHGSVTFTAGGVSYTPAPNYFGTDSFTYTISDNGTADPGHTDTATVNVTINNVNDAPDAVDDSATVDEDTTNNAINVLANDTDADNLIPPFNAGLTVIAVTQGTHGSVTFTAGGVSYTPAPNYFGTDSFTYTISDNGTGDPGHTDTATVNVTINNINDAPDAVDDSATVDEDTTNNAINVLANDTDADNLTPPFNAGLTVIAVTQGTNGSVTFTATGVSYTPNANYFGSDSFTYTISDNGTADPGHTDTATVNVTINNINDAPDAVDDSATVDEDTINNAINVLANDTDADNLTPPFNAGLTVIAVTQGTHGSVTFTAGGVSYTPAPNYFGSDSFTYTISDNGTGDPGHTDTATVNVTITNVNDTPDAVDDNATVSEDSSNNAINVLANDTDADNLTPPFNAGLTVISVTQGAHGSVTFTAGGVSYTPAPNYFGPDSFTYTISDNGTNSPEHTDTATVNVTVTNVNDAPIITALNIAPGVINENDSAVLTGSFSDADGGDPHTVVISWGDGSPNTTLTLAGGVFTFTASHQYKDDNPTNTASDINTVTVSVCDGGQDGNLATSGDNACAGQNTTITVRNVAPVITTANGPATPQPSGSSITVTANFTDVGTQDTHGCSVNWDDGTTSNGTVTEVNGSGMCTASHTYTSPGVYSVVVTITDDDTGTTSRAIDLQFVVIFDPGAGFVTGGGWIMSPAGACQLTPGCVTATGKANFGFVSKYKKGSNTPDGQTEFQFHAGDINFHSSAYDLGSLVVSGFKAQYRGTGEVNGVPGYKFVLTAYDGNVNGGGGIDRFRIKITKDGIVVYDNKIGASEDIDLANPMAISGGSIVIHK